MNEQKFPWSFDKPIEEIIENWVVYDDPLIMVRWADYLVERIRQTDTRLKKAEMERDALRGIADESMKTIERLNNALDDCGYIRDGEEYGK